MKIQEGEAHNIFCPAYDCFQLVPVEIIESVVSKEMDKRYLQFDIKVNCHIFRMRLKHMLWVYSDSIKMLLDGRYIAVLFKNINYEIIYLLLFPNNF